MFSKAFLKYFNIFHKVDSLHGKNNLVFLFAYDYYYHYINYKQNLHYIFIKILCYFKTDF